MLWPSVFKRESLHAIREGCCLQSISHVYWWRIKRRSQQQLKAADKYRGTHGPLERWKKDPFQATHHQHLSESTDTPRTERVDRVALGVGFDAILWYFIWLCWFDCVRSSILPDVSDILQKHFALLAWPSTHQNFNGCLMVLMHHLNADPDVKGEGGGMWREHAWNLKVRWQRSQQRGGMFSKCRYYTGVEYQMFESLGLKKMERFHLKR